MRTSSGNDLEALAELTAFEGWSVYGARLPSCELRAAVLDIIREHFGWNGPESAQTGILRVSCQESGLHTVTVDQLTASHEMSKPSGLQQAAGLSQAAQQIQRAHQAVLEVILSSKFISEHGFYGNSSSWRDQWQR